MCKSYRPIALLNTDAKLMSACIAESISFAAKEHQLLPKNHFGGLPGRTTTDAIHYLMSRIRKAHRKRQVVAVLFLDIQAAFPSTSVARLIHDLRTAGIPKTYTDWLHNKFCDRRTTLTFDDFTSDQFSIQHGLDQGCPLSPLLYLFYNAGLLRTTRGKDEDSSAFIDDASIVAIANSFKEAHAMLKDIDSREGGIQHWCDTHTSVNEASKLVLMHFASGPREDEEESLEIQGVSLKPASNTKYLGFYIDKHLTGKTHANAALGKGTRTANQISRLSRTATGVSARYMRMLYHTVVIPKMLYAADCFIRPFHPTDDRLIRNPKRKTARAAKCKGSASFANKMASVQRSMAIAATGALRSTATEAVDYFAGFLPFRLLLNKLCHRATIRMLTLPENHPLTTHIRFASACPVKRRPSQLHYRTHSS